LRNLPLVGRYQLFLLQLGADALGNLRHGLGLAFACETVTRRAVIEKLGEVQRAVPGVVWMGLKDHAFDFAQEAVGQSA
jgi:hypothetical protein